jgi:hypothetical protein
MTAEQQLGGEERAIGSAENQYVVGVFHDWPQVTKRSVGRILFEPIVARGATRT